MLQKTFCLSLIFSFLSTVLATNTLIAQEDGTAVPRSITHIAGNVYKFQNNRHGAMFVVTDSSIIVTDPINADAVVWLKAELTERFDIPVSHMIYSHTDADHNSGGEYWGDGLSVVAHDNAPQNMQARNATSPLPTQTFSESGTLYFEENTIELVYLGLGHSTDLIAMIVRPENILFSVDAATPQRIPFKDFQDDDIDGVINQLKTAENLDFDMLLTSHGTVGTKDDIAKFRIYIEELKAQVMAGLEAGKSKEELMESVTMDEYKNWDLYDTFRAMNVRGMTEWLQTPESSLSE